MFFFLTGLAGGTLIYVVVFEVLAREKTKNVPGPAQLACVVVGFGTMLVVELFGEHHHGGEGHSGGLAAETPVHSLPLLGSAD